VATKIKHPHLIPLFQRVFPVTVKEVIFEQRAADVQFCGIPFTITPSHTCKCHLQDGICDDCLKWVRAGFPSDTILVWGAPHANPFPDGP
jgi:hypothetical protein